MQTDSNNLSVAEIRELRERLIARADHHGAMVCDEALEGFSLLAAAKAGRLYREDKHRNRLARGVACRGGIKSPARYADMVADMSGARSRAELDLTHRCYIVDLSYDRGDIKAAFGFVLRDKGWKV